MLSVVRKNAKKIKLNFQHGTQVFAKNSDFLIPIYLQSYALDLRFFNITMNSIRFNNLNLIYHWFTISVCKDIGIRKFELVTDSIPLNYKKLYWSVNGILLVK